ncbi:MAG: ubiquinone biosynthesis regulatory protein kinase UbiB [Pseudomonadales bacterium]|nr:ubiquinone biosynthesis regulatory protein kinase UbiB [Pseudomonadales bacterium]
MSLGIRRLFKIGRVLIKHQLYRLVSPEQLPLHLRIFLQPLYWLPESSRSAGERIRNACEELGPVFVKFGQILSTRRDLFSEEISDELKLLQDQVPPFANDTAAQIVEDALGKPIDELFESFSEYPLASASVAQVHDAVMPNGDQVCVKIIRPGIKKTIDQDLTLLYTLARLVHRYAADAHRLRLVEVVKDYESTIYGELDLVREAANTSYLKGNFEDSPLLYVPNVYWDYVKTNVMVQERIFGTPVSEVETLTNLGVDMKRLAEVGVEIFFTQVFQHNFFHADMHPGNIFVSTKNLVEPQYIAIDCAIMGSLSEEDQQYLMGMMLAFFKRDYRSIAQLHVDSGWVGSQIKVNEFEMAIRTVCEPIFDKPLKEIYFGELMIQLFHTARRFDMTIQPQLILLQKTLLNIEGLGRQLYPDLDLWKTAFPIMEKWMREKNSPTKIAKAMLKQAPELFRQLPELPQLAIDALKQIQSLEKTIAASQPPVQTHKPDRSRGRVLGGLCLVAAPLLISQEALLPMFSQVPAFNWLLFGAGVYLLSTRNKRLPSD